MSTGSTGGEANAAALQVVEDVCRAMGAGWDHKSLSPAEWITQKLTEDRFGGLDFVAVFTDAADYLSSARCKRTYTSPSLFLLNQLKSQAERRSSSRGQDGLSNRFDSLRSQT